ncbi:hypothetical protein AGOR_G00025710 [Albula goreensis]|uniref:Uncharacterized protein n=1 Tax=Albula goreensis TaxID=1534307 RepID=A0A8T3E250_9TELE|nr:hypothetical protein AGOR_G00025710 [Albula goreensis]
MKMYLLTTLCLLVVVAAQEVTELTSCKTKENNLRMDCKYKPTDPPTDVICEYRQDNKLMGSTDPKASPEPAFKNRANVTIIAGPVCRLSLTGFSEDKPKNNTCIIKQKNTASKSELVDAKKLATCSAFSILLQTSPKAMLVMTFLPLLLETLYA